jgi:hypothetical protein
MRCGWMDIIVEVDRGTITAAFKPTVQLDGWICL